MSVVLLAVGSRGDVAPMIALGRELRRRGADVTVVALRDHTPAVTGAGLRPAPVDASLADAGVPAAALARGPAAYTREVSRWLAGIAPRVVAAELAAVGPGDVVVAGLLSVDDADALRRARGCRVWHALYAPLLPTRYGASGLAAVRPRGASRLNRWAGAAAAAAVAGMCTTTGRALRRELGLPPTSAARFVRLLTTAPTLLAAGRALVPPAPDWPPHVRQTGAWIEDAPPPPAPGELAAFLGAGPPPLFVSFGSIAGAERADVDLVVRAARRADRRVVFGAPVTGADLPPTVHAVRDVSYRWLFPRTAGVVHHGGAGTVAEALLAGVPSVAVPVGADQPFHGRRLHALGVGPEPVPRRRLTEERLAALFDDLTGERADRYRASAESIGQQIRDEPGVRAAADAVLATG